jgi:hypothetical protein
LGGEVHDILGRKIPNQIDYLAMIYIEISLEEFKQVEMRWIGLIGKKNRIRFCRATYS